MGETFWEFEAAHVIWTLWKFEFDRKLETWANNTLLEQ